MTGRCDGCHDPGAHESLTEHRGHYTPLPGESVGAGREMEEGISGRGHRLHPSVVLLCFVFSVLFQHELA